MKIAFFGTPELSARILEACIADSEISIAYVVSQPDKPVGRSSALVPSPVSTLAIATKIPLFCPEKIRNNADFFAAISSIPVDYFVVVAYGKILPPEILALPLKIPMNVHGSILPLYRGASPIQSALLSGDAETGVTIMRMDPGMDDGGILSIQSFPISPNETAESLFEKFAQISPGVLIETMKAHFRGEVTIQEQDHSRATYTKKFGKEDGCINWNTWTALQIYRSWQAFTSWPGIWTTYNGKRCKILTCALPRTITGETIFHATRENLGSRYITEISESAQILSEPKGIPGQLSKRNGTIFVYTIDGIIELGMVLVEGKSKKPAAEVFFDGDLLENPK